MIIKCRRGLELVLTMPTRIDPAILCHTKMGCDLLLEMNPQTVNDTISLGVRLIVTSRDGTRIGRLRASIDSIDSIDSIASIDSMNHSLHPIHMLRL
jgi:hypothetical protein